MRDKGYIALAKPDLPSDQVLVVVKADSEIAALSDLPADSRVLVTANCDIERIGLDVLQGTAITADSVQWLHARTFTELARRLMANEAEIGLFLASSFRGLNTGTQGSLKILFETEFEDFGHVMLLHPDFADQADKLRAALLNMAQSPVSRMTLEDLGMAKGFVAAGGAGDGKRDGGEAQDGQAEAETIVEHQTADTAQAASTAEAEQTTAAEGQPENG